MKSFLKYFTIISLVSVGMLALLPVILNCLGSATKCGKSNMNIIKQLAFAVEGYRQDYGDYPLEMNISNKPIHLKHRADFFDRLEKNNPRNKMYFYKSYSSSNDYNFFMILDNDYDNKIEFDGKTYATPVLIYTYDNNDQRIFNVDNK